MRERAACFDGWFPQSPCADAREYLRGDCGDYGCWRAELLRGQCVRRFARSRPDSDASGGPIRDCYLPV